MANEEAAFHWKGFACSCSTPHYCFVLMALLWHSLASHCTNTVLPSGVCDMFFPQINEHTVQLVLLSFSVSFLQLSWRKNSISCGVSLSNRNCSSLMLIMFLSRCYALSHVGSCCDTFNSLKPGTHHAIFVVCWTQRRRKDDCSMVCAHQRQLSPVDFTNATVVGPIRKNESVQQLLHGVCGSKTSVASTDRPQTNHSETFP